jgi:hypothetical protein
VLARVTEDIPLLGHPERSPIGGAGNIALRHDELSWTFA